MNAHTPTRDVAPVPQVGAWAARAWRTIFALSVGVVYASTHWPRLHFQTPDQPIDKFLHAAAFGVLTGILWQTGWVARRWVCMVIVAAWAAFDEATQALPGLGRSAEFSDYAADLMGILIAGFFLAASRPVPGVLSHALAARRRFLAQRLLDSPLSWLHIATGSVLGLAVGCVGYVALDSQYRAPRPVHAAVVGAILGAIAGAFLMREYGMRALHKRMMAARPCLRCGAAQAGNDAAGSARTDAAADEAGTPVEPGACATCGEPRNALSWSQFAQVSGETEVRLCAPVVAQALGIVVGVGLLLPWVATLLHARSPGIFRGGGNMPIDLQRVIDITFMAGIAAWSLWRCRRRIARALEKSGERCLACGYDLRAVAHEVASGVCTECGEPFVRAQVR